MRSIAIVGSGPAGCYTAQALRRAWPDASIKIYEREPVPYGLIRYGVAPDHQGTKAITRQFDRLFARDGVEFVGGVEVGRDVPLTRLRDENDVVVLAHGLYGDRALGVPGDDHPLVYGAGAVTRYLNGHPGGAELQLDLGGAVAVVGAGNVAMDLIRLIAKREAAFQDSDVPDHVRTAFAGHRVISLAVLSRSAAEDAKFDPVMMRELGRLPDVRVAVVPSLPDSDSPRVAALAEVVSASAPSHPRIAIEFHFGWRPSRITEERDAASRLLVEVIGSDGEVRSIRADSVITAIGFQEEAEHPIVLRELVSDEADLARGRLASGLYCVGWIKRGPTGTIPENRIDARTVTASIVADAEASLFRSE